MSVVAVFADGGVIHRNPSPYGGTIAYCHVDEHGKRVESLGALVLHNPGSRDYLPGVPMIYNSYTPLVTNNMTEMLALLACLQALPEGWSGPVHSDSQVTLGRLFWGWKLTGLPAQWIEWGSRCLKRLGKLEPVLLQGHPTKADLARGVGAKRGYPVSKHNVWADKECGRVAKLLPAWRMQKED